MSGRPRRRRRILVAWGVLAAIVVAAPPLAVELLYRYGLRQLGPPPSPPSPSASSPLAATAFWIQAGGVMPPSVERMSGWRWSWGLAWRLAFDSESRPRPGAGEQMASRAARAWITPLRPLSGGMGRWHLAFWSATIWMTRNRSGPELIQEVIDTSYYGRGATGLDAAAVAYFGKPPQELAPDQVALLAALTVSPRSLHVDCHPERAVAARNGLVDKLLAAGAIDREAHDVAIARGLGVVPGTCENDSR